MPAVTHTKPGYKAIRGEGEFRLCNVPIFVECERGEFKTDAKWIQRAVAHAKQQQRDHYYPPLHYIHHGTGEVEHAGWFEITRAAPITLKAKRMTAVYADLVINNPRIAELIEQKRIPYRSIEVFDPEGDPAIDTLALLDHEPPFHELPMLFVSEVEDAGPVHKGTTAFGWTMERLDTPQGPVTCFRKIKRTCFSQGDQMTATETQPEETKPAEDFGAGITDPDTAEQFAEDDKKDEDDEKMQESESLDVGPIVKAIKSGKISIADMDALLEAIQAQNATEEEPADEEPAPAAVPGAAMMKPSKDAIKLQARVDVLEVRDKERDAKEKRVEDVRQALDRLEGRPMGADLEGRLVKFHKDHGPEAFGNYVDEVVKTFGELHDDDTTVSMTKGNVPDVAMQYADKGGPNAVEQAAKFAREWEELRTRGLTVTQENYVAGRMRDAAKEN